MYQRMFEGLTFYEKLSKIIKSLKQVKTPFTAAFWNAVLLPHRRSREILWRVHHGEPCGSAVVSNYDPALCTSAQVESRWMFLFSLGTWTPVPSRQLVNCCLPGEGRDAQVQVQQSQAFFAGSSNPKLPSDIVEYDENGSGVMTCLK